MKNFVTELEAREVDTGLLKIFAGDRVQAPSLELAKEWCSIHKPYLKVLGELSLEVDLESGEATDYYTQQKN